MNAPNELIAKGIQETNTQSDSIHIYAYDSNHAFSACNHKQALDLEAKHESEVVGLSIFDLYPYEHAELLRQNNEKVMQQGLPHRSIEPLFLDDGTVINYYTQKFPLFNKDGKIVGVSGYSMEFSGSNRDISPALSSMLSSLPKQQYRCAIFLLSGLSSKEIAAKMGLSFRTIEYYFTILKKKFECRNNTHLAALLGRLVSGHTDLR